MLETRSPVLGLIGCKTRDLVDLPRLMAAAGFEIRTSADIHDGDHVAFCLSCPHGPTEGTRRALEACAGRIIVPIAIVLTEFPLVDDDSLRELVTLEEMELLCGILPRSDVERLPIMYDFDPILADRLRSRMHEGNPGIRCFG